MVSDLSISDPFRCEEVIDSRPQPRIAEVVHAGDDVGVEASVGGYICEMDWPQLIYDLKRFVLIEEIHTIN